jgi:hypothetical protein
MLAPSTLARLPQIHLHEQATKDLPVTSSLLSLDSVPPHRLSRFPSFNLVLISPYLHAMTAVTVAFFQLLLW